MVNASAQILPSSFSRPTGEGASFLNRKTLRVSDRRMRGGSALPQRPASAFTTFGLPHRGRRKDKQEKERSAEVELFEEVVALVVDDDEGREILNFDLPDSFHPELGILMYIDFFDAVFGKLGRAAANRR